MPRRSYSPDEKADALQALARNAGDVAATHYQTGIPQRTLYLWRNEEWQLQRLQRHTPLPPPPSKIATFETNLEAYEYLRDRMTQIFNKFPPDLSYLPPYLRRDHESARITIVSIIIKLTELINLVGPLETEVGEIEYVHEYITEDPRDGLLPN